MGTLHGIHYQINKKEKVKTVNFFTYFSRIAAVLIVPLFLVSSYLVFENFSKEVRMQTVFSPMASRTSFDLPDGSKVWLNAGSSLSFPDHFSKKSRSVKLAGEAYFDIKKDGTRFEIETGSVKVNVLGTTLGVAAYRGEATTVTLLSGQLAIETSEGNEVFLIPGEQAVVQDGTGAIHKREVNPYLCTAWKDNLLVFDDEPFREALPRLERWYNLDIVIADEAINDIRLTGTFQFEGISEILQLMEITNSILYTQGKEERRIILNLK